MAAVALTGVRHQALGDNLGPPPTSGQSRLVLVAAVIGFFVVTLDAVAVNVALPSIRHAFGGGISGLQWVVDAYTLAFAGLLLGAGALSDRVGARRAFTAGAGVFAAASAACGLAPGLGWLVGVRFVQGSAAAVLMPASMALLSHAFPEGPDRARAVGLWAMGGWRRPRPVRSWAGCSRCATCPRSPPGRCSCRWRSSAACSLPSAPAWPGAWAPGG